MDAANALKVRVEDWLLRTKGVPLAVSDEDVADLWDHPALGIYSVVVDDSDAFSRFEREMEYVMAQSDEIQRGRVVVAEMAFVQSVHMEVLLQYPTVAVRDAVGVRMRAQFPCQLAVVPADLTE
jgi:hypothetical protein